MKKIIILLTIAILALSGCSNEGAYNEHQIAQQKEEIRKLQEEIYQLQTEKDKLQSEVKKEKIDKGLAKYVITLQIKQSHFTLDLGQHLNDEMNEIRLELPVDKEFYDDVEIGTVLDDSFRVGFFIINGSFGSWNIKVVDKKII